MAFQQPTRPARQPVLESVRTRERPQPEQTRVDDTQEWVLFSPAAPTSHTETGSEETPRTVDVSRFSDFESIDTPTRLRTHDMHRSRREADEEAELDSLDSHLHDFRELTQPMTSSAAQHVGGVFPAHDGLGTFPATGDAVQEQLYSYEQFNPNRIRRRSSTAVRAVGLLEYEEQPTKHDEKSARIHRWRLEQSQLVLNEISREIEAARKMESRSESVAPQFLHDEPVSEPHDAGESLWAKITRKIIQDFIGMDDSVLSLILGETIIPDEDLASEPSSARLSHSKGWRDKLIERIATEFGTLLHRLTTTHPGAFSTYVRTKGPFDFVGRSGPTASATHLLRDIPEDVEQQCLDTDDHSEPRFSPTLPRQPWEQWGFDDSLCKTEQDHLRLEQEYWERELDITMIFSFLKTRFQRGRGSTDTSARHRPTMPSPSTSAYSRPAARAAMIRHHHPLVSGSSHVSSSPGTHDFACRRPSRLDTSRGPSNLASPLSPRASNFAPPLSPFATSLRLKRKNSSCASESSNKSLRSCSRGRSRAAGAASTSAASSRNYWDLEGSLGGGGSASAIASMGGIGTWGEV